MIYQKKKIIYVELGLLILSVFAFAYIMHEVEPLFPQVSDDSEPLIFYLMLQAISVLKRPMVPFVSAQEFGCCEETVDGSLCALSDETSCDPSSIFAPNAICSESSFCVKGCCYDEAAGVYDRNSLEKLCAEDWIPDPNCEVPGANKGCCVLGDFVKYETLGQCKTDSENFALSGDGVVDWRPGLNEAECTLLSYSSYRGACVLGGGTCKTTTGEICQGLNGDFNPGFLCTSGALETDCEKTAQTVCLDGHDEVYFVDSCGNSANIYDSRRLEDQSYWEKIISKDDSCNADSETGNAGSESCGNCNRFAGGICASASVDNFNPDHGQNYCREVSCMYKGDVYENGASWCVYDGAVGNGDDVVGSRHWRYVCNQGMINVEPCADYRNEICVQSNTEENGRVVFQNSQCIANNWRRCMELNNEDEDIEDCEETLNCRIDRVDIGDKFKFDVCVPKYPGGFDLRNERTQLTAEGVCGAATRTCQVIYKPKFFGGCKRIHNEGCLREEFAQEMNDFCRGIADCGGSVNINGDFVANYNLDTKTGTGHGVAPDLSDSWIRRLEDLANPREGQFAEVEDYSELLEAAGIPSAGGEDYGMDFVSGLGTGVGGVALAANWALGLDFVAGSMSTSTLTSAISFTGAAAGAAIGMYAGIMIAEAIGLSPFGTYLMAAGGASVGMAAAAHLLPSLAKLVWDPATFLIIAAVLIIFSLLFKGDDCDPDIVEFTCNPWLPPTGGEDCEVCNEDSLKPCSKYRCESLGASCELVNVGTEEEMCVDGSVNDVNPPVISPQLDIISPGYQYRDIEEGGFSLRSDEGDCIDAYTPLRFGINTDEPAYCKFDLEENEFENMAYDFGPSYYLYNHTTQFNVPNIENGDLDMYVTCQDSNGHKNSRFYMINICVNQGPDLTAPLIIDIDPNPGSKVGFESEDVSVEVITNELATCKWDSTDKGYSSMENSFECDDVSGAPSGKFGYLCQDELPTLEDSNSYFIRCADQPWFIGTGNESLININAESFEYALNKPSSKIQIDHIFPAGDFKIATEIASFNIEIMTSGGGDVHHCSYSYKDFDSLIPLLETGLSRIHTQPSSPAPGLKTIFVECDDETGDFARGETTFEIIKDTSPPMISRVWEDAGEIFVVTTEEAECGYTTDSCSFSWEDSVFMGDSFVHAIDSVTGQTYYVKCRDGFGNMPTRCSIIVTAT
jgi:hypothetical protein